MSFVQIIQSSVTGFIRAPVTKEIAKKVAVSLTATLAVKAGSKSLSMLKDKFSGTDLKLQLKNLISTKKKPRTAKQLAGDKKRAKTMKLRKNAKASSKK